MTSVADTHPDADDDLSEISPELVLVDPDLAQRLREREPAPVLEDVSPSTILRLVADVSAGVHDAAVEEVVDATPDVPPADSTASEPIPVLDTLEPAVESHLLPGEEALERALFELRESLELPESVVPRPAQEAEISPTEAHVPLASDLEGLIVPAPIHEPTALPHAEPELEPELEPEPEPEPEPLAYAPPAAVPEQEPPPTPELPPATEPIAAPEPVVAPSKPALVGPPLVVDLGSKPLAPPSIPPPPMRRRRRGRRVVLGAIVATVLVTGILSLTDESPLPAVPTPSWPTADDGSSGGAPIEAPSTPKPSGTVKKPKAPAKQAKKPKASARPATTPPPPATQTKKKKQPAATAPEPRRFAWAPVQGAVGYHVELFRGSDRVFSKDTTQPVLEIGPTWTHEGRVMRLTEGSYRWYVWSVRESGRDPRAIVQATLSVP